ncbi:hypothetical protein [Saccharopolyspora mangrovi]|uniref:Antitoxin n=1 Tax=Saccharopolyspora mangrovi TaxID=3082379 RepID=A0ABU6A7A9_9PSEU|nr:hypothetical protein [Saccharopolyspora sp. S2-29]MEB3367369.1 hypothetical protein [Saccharopolyspora sp. S2-29]
MARRYAFEWLEQHHLNIAEREQLAREYAAQAERFPGGDHQGVVHAPDIEDFWSNHAPADLW